MWKMILVAAALFATPGTADTCSKTDPACARAMSLYEALSVSGRVVSGWFYHGDTRHLELAKLGDALRAYDRETPVGEGDRFADCYSATSSLIAALGTVGGGWNKSVERQIIKDNIRSYAEWMAKYEQKLSAEPTGRTAAVMQAC